MLAAAAGDEATHPRQSHARRGTDGSALSFGLSVISVAHLREAVDAMLTLQASVMAFFGRLCSQLLLGKHHSPRQLPLILSLARLPISPPWRTR
jgi:hypothetical protein